MMLKKPLIHLCFYSIIFMLWGCPYGSTVNLGEPVELVKAELIGKWTPANEFNDETPSYYIVDELDTVSYAVSHYQYDQESQSYKDKQYVAHTTLLDDILFLNVVKKGNKDYVFYRVDLKRGEMDLFEVTDNIDEKFESTEKIRSFFQSNMKKSFFYNRDEVKLLKK